MAKSAVLAIETSGRTGSVAAGIGDEVLGQITFSGVMTHSRELFPSIDKLLANIGVTSTDIGDIYVSTGPGSFTGIRIGVAAAKMMAFANNAKVIGVNTMDVIAANATKYTNYSDYRAFAKKTAEKIGRIATILDAKRGQFYLSVFSRTDKGWSKTASELLMTAGEFLAEFGRGVDSIWLLGEGLVYYKDAFCGERVHFLPKESRF